MIAHLYEIPSGFANVEDRIIIHAAELESYPGNWLHAKIELLEGARVIDDEYNDGAILLSSGEVIRNVYTKSSRRIDGDAFVQLIGIYDKQSRPIIKKTVRWK